MNSHLCYLYEITNEKRIGEENSLRPVPPYEAPSPHCFKCGSHLVGEHECGLSLHQLLVRNRHEVERQCEQEAREAEKKTTLKVKGKRVSV